MFAGQGEVKGWAVRRDEASDCAAISAKLRDCAVGSNISSCSIVQLNSVFYMFTCAYRPVAWPLSAYDDSFSDN